MLTCQELTELVTDYLEGKMPLGRRLSFLLHLSMCKHCRAYVRQVKVAIQAPAALPVSPPPPEVREVLLRSFREWKR